LSKEEVKDIVISITPKAMHWPGVREETVFPVKITSSIPEVLEGGTVIIHCGCEGSHNIEQLEKDFNQIIDYLKRLKSSFESVRVNETK